MATEGEEKKARAPRASLEDIVKMSRHLATTHKQDPMTLIAQSFSKLDTLHRSFHGQDDHWKKG
jgi:hypothetical protein